MGCIFHGEKIKVYSTCSFVTSQIQLQDFVHSFAFGTSFYLIPFLFNSGQIFFWSRSKNPVLSKLFNALLISFHFCAFCQHPLFQFFNHSFFLTLYFSYSSFIFCFFFDPNSPFKSLVNKFKSCLSFFISPSILLFHLGSFFSYSLFSSILSVLLPTYLQL